ncbi:C-type lectin protein [Ranid herpesvirus 3]|uniref:C-type lectin protein n=1 Tax=Ranid herpesvirus 3 TaxID=1987509 RepID=A0A1X9T5H3_9VIRU|nr:C-type lectin protein [Ranid herpesvirus 3]ARR28954.1 C-type lectin protein [Ranid herpesvirus 3]
MEDVKSVDRESSLNESGNDPMEFDSISSIYYRGEERLDMWSSDEDVDIPPDCQTRPPTPCPYDTYPSRNMSIRDRIYFNWRYAKDFATEGYVATRYLIFTFSVMLLLLIVSLCVAINVRCVSVAMCPKGWMKDGDLCFQVQDYMANYTEAVDLCSREKAELMNHQTHFAVVQKVCESWNGLRYNETQKKYTFKDNTAIKYPTTFTPIAKSNTLTWTLVQKHTDGSSLKPVLCFKNLL